MAAKCEENHLKEWLGKDLQIELKDGRVIVGRFVCTDNAPNVILSRCKESWKGETESRDIGLVMISGKHIRCIYLLGERQEV